MIETVDVYNYGEAFFGVIVLRFLNADGGQDHEISFEFSRDRPLQAGGVVSWDVDCCDEDEAYLGLSHNCIAILNPADGCHSTANHFRIDVTFS